MFTYYTGVIEQIINNRLVTYSLPFFSKIRTFNLDSKQEFGRMPQNPCGRMGQNKKCTLSNIEWGELLIPMTPHDLASGMCRSLRSIPGQGNVTKHNKESFINLFIFQQIKHVYWVLQLSEIKIYMSPYCKLNGIKVKKCKI